MSSDIMDLMMQFGREHPEGFEPAQLIEWLVTMGISKEEANDAVDFQMQTMEMLDD